MTTNEGLPPLAIAVRALEAIRHNETSVFDDDLQTSVLVSMDMDEAVKIADDALTALRAQPSLSVEHYAFAAHIVDSLPVLNVFAACEWNELSNDGQVWVTEIVRQTVAHAHADSDLLTAAEDLMNSTFAKHYRLISPFKELAAAIASARGEQ